MAALSGALAKENIVAALEILLPRTGAPVVDGAAAWGLSSVFTPLSAYSFMLFNRIAKSGKKVLFVATKKQAKQVVAEKAQSVNMPYVIERWPGGMLTNFCLLYTSLPEITMLIM